MFHELASPVPQLFFLAFFLAWPLFFFVIAALGKGSEPLINADEYDRL